jgi:hypothetical protein
MLPNPIELRAQSRMSDALAQAERDRLVRDVRRTTAEPRPGLFTSMRRTVRQRLQALGAV